MTRPPPSSTRPDPLFPTRRSSDLEHLRDVLAVCDLVVRADADFGHGVVADRASQGGRLETQHSLAGLRPPACRQGVILALDVEYQADRKSTRLNSSH